MTLSQDLLAVLVDPQDKGAMHYLESERCLYNERSRSKYTINENGIAILLANEAQRVSEEEHNKLMALVSSGQSVTTGTSGS